MAIQTAQQPEQDQPRRASADDQQLSIAEMVRVMDVASALKRERSIAERELNREETKQLLREKLMETARLTGDPVTEDEIDAAIEHYFDNLHEFQPPEASGETLLAHLYVMRTTIAKWACAIGVAAALWWGMFSFGIMPGKARDARIAAELQGHINKSAAAAIEMATVPNVKERIAQLTKQADAYREAGKLTEMQEIAEQIAAQEMLLRQEYTIEVVQSPKSGIDRYADGGEKLSGYYLIVQARNPDGSIRRMQIRDAETGKIKTVSQWGELVPKETYDQIAADKQADGIVDQTAFARKSKGELKVNVTMQAPDGGVLSRGRQITQW